MSKTTRVRGLTTTDSDNPRTVEWSPLTKRLAIYKTLTYAGDGYERLLISISLDAREREELGRALLQEEAGDDD